MVKSSFQEEFLSANSIRGAPRYFEGRMAALKPRIQAMFLWAGSGVLKQNISNFYWLIVMPEALEKVESMFLMDLAS